MFLVTIMDSGAEVFDFYTHPDEPFFVPDCPLHPAAHPLQGDVVDGAAAWVCPSAKRLVRYMRVTAEAA
jgi:hypothetical protein